MGENAARPSGRPAAALRSILWTTLRPYVVHRLAREIATPRAPAEWVRFVFDYEMAVGPRRRALHFRLRPLQVPSEITRLVELVARERPRRVLEIGSAGGGTLFLFARVAAPDALLVGMDLTPHGAQGVPGWRAALYEHGFPGPGQRVRIVRGDSHAESTRARVLEILGREPVDFLFIDADHTYAGVKRDFELYAPLVRPGGLIAMHDILADVFHRTGVPTPSKSGEVFRFWQELKATHPNRGSVVELVEDADQDGYGIGALRG